MTVNKQVDSGPGGSEVYLVTGASGFVGGHLVRHLISCGIHVRALVRRKESAATLEALGAEVLIGDLESKESLSAAVAGVSGVYHIAAIFRVAGVPDEVYTRVNVEGTRHLLECAIAANVKRFIHCSTIGVLGDVGNRPADENTPYSPGDIYQESKVAGEKLVLEYFSRGSIQGVVIRPAMVYGPGDMRMLKLFKMIANGTFFYVGNGKELVHFIDVRDLVRAFHSAMNHAELNAETYIIAGAQAIELKNAVKMIAEIMGVPVPKIHLPVKPLQWLGSICEAICKPLGIEPPIFRRRVDFFTKSRSFATMKASNDLGFKPAKNLEEELRDSIEWYIEHGYIKQKKSLSSQIVRSIDGRIYDWNIGAENLYGWKRKQVVGQVTHALFKTEFPDSLNTINHKLITARRWEGELVHVKHDGSRVVVQSQWELRDSKNGEPHSVVEINRERGSCTVVGNVSAKLFALCSLFSPVTESALLPSTLVLV